MSGCVGVAAMRGAAAALWWPDRLNPSRKLGARLLACSAARPRSSMVVLLIVSWVGCAVGIDGRQPASCTGIESADGVYVPQCVEPARQPDSSCIRFAARPHQMESLRAGRVVSLRAVASRSRAGAFLPASPRAALTFRRAPNHATPTQNSTRSCLPP